MKFEHKIPKIYYSCSEDINPEREHLEVSSIQKRFPEYEVISSKDMFVDHKEWLSRIDATIEKIDVIIFSCPDECKEGFYFTEKSDHELTLAIKNKKAICIISGKRIKLLSNSNYVNTAIRSINERR